MANKFGDFSRLRKTEQIIVNGNETVGVWNKPSWLRSLPEERFIKVFRVSNRVEGRPDLISEQVYGTPLLAWVLVSFNAMHYQDDEARLGLNWPRAGAILRYPVESIVLPEIV